jgi:CDP-diacylglycerol--glycerol-3-phosphate 3-phosphatidyltransferase
VTGSIVSPTARQRVRDLATPVATALGRLGLTPNALTVMGFLGTCVAALAAANQWWLAAGVLVLVFGIFDLFDGTLARATGQASKLGAFLDSTLDRAGEAIVYIGIAAGCLAAEFSFGALLAAAAMAAAFMVSYTRAKSESLGFTSGTGMGNVGVAPREVRVAILGLGLLVTAGFGGDVMGHMLTTGDPVAEAAGFALAASLVLITILATLTTIQRMVHVLDQSREG